MKGIYHLTIGLMGCMSDDVYTSSDSADLKDAMLDIIDEHMFQIHEWDEQELNEYLDELKEALDGREGFYWLCPEGNCLFELELFECPYNDCELREEYLNED